MNILKTAGLVGLGYMLRDTNMLRGRYRYYGSDVSFRDYFHELAINKLDVIFYGCERHSKLSTRIPYNPGDRYRSYFAYNGQNKEPVIAKELCRFDTRAKAEEAYEKFSDMIEKYGSVSVSDWSEIYYNLMPCDESQKLKTCYTDSQYGWTETPEWDINRLFGGWYEVKLPRPQRFWRADIVRGSLK